MAVLAVAAVAASVTIATPASAYTGPTSGTTHTVTSILKLETGTHYGPTTYTRGEVGTIKSFTTVTGCGGKVYYSANVSVTSSPLVETPAASPDMPIPPCDVRHAPDSATSPLGSDGVMSPLSWWNPFSWSWRNIMGAAWDDVFQACAKGAASGLIGGLAANKIAPFILRGAEIEAGPYGYAVLAISGCIVDIFG